MRGVGSLHTQGAAEYPRTPPSGEELCRSRASKAGKRTEREAR